MSCEVCSGWVTYCHRCLTCFKGLCCVCTQVSGSVVSNWPRCEFWTCVLWFFGIYILFLNFLRHQTMDKVQKYSSFDRLRRLNIECVCEVSWWWAFAFHSVKEFIKADQVSSLQGRTPITVLWIRTKRRDTIYPSVTYLLYAVAFLVVLGTLWCLEEPWEHFM
jgi:hypothetical protein